MCCECAQDAWYVRYQRAEISSISGCISMTIVSKSDIRVLQKLTHYPHLTNMSFYALDNTELILRDCRGQLTQP